MTYRERLEAAREKSSALWERVSIGDGNDMASAFEEAAAPRDALIAQLAEALEKLAAPKVGRDAMDGNPVARDALSELERFLAQGEKQ